MIYTTNFVFCGRVHNLVYEPKQTLRTRYESNIYGSMIRACHVQTSQKLKVYESWFTSDPVNK